jgi:hypothetical protein
MGFRPYPLNQPNPMDPEYQEMNGTWGKWHGFFKNPNEAKRWLNQPTMMIPNANLPTNEQLEGFAKQIMEAITDVKAVQEDMKSKGRNETQHEGRFTGQWWHQRHIEAASWRTAEVVRDMHRDGIVENRRYTPLNQGPGAAQSEREYSYRQRINAICEALRVDKGSCERLLMGFAPIDRFLNELFQSPVAVSKRKAVNSRTNANKSRLMAMGKAAQQAQRTTICAPQNEDACEGQHDGQSGDENHTLAS